MSVVDIDHGYDRTLDLLGDLGNVSTLVGIDSSRHPEQAIYGAVHEFGSSTQREAAFIRGSADADARGLSDAIGDGLGKAIDTGRKTDIENGTRKAGERLRLRIQRAISSAGLVDSGALRDSIEVRNDQ